MEKLFFDVSRQAFNQIANIYDFVWPTSAALWNLRWQVKGFVDVNQKHKRGRVEGRFIRWKQELWRQYKKSIRRKHLGATAGGICKVLIKLTFVHFMRLGTAIC